MSGLIEGALKYKGRLAPGLHGGRNYFLAGVLHVFSGVTLPGLLHGSNNRLGGD
jgi:hypothetical protein